MGHKVQLYVYDLSQGMARAMSMQFLGIFSTQVCDPPHSMNAISFDPHYISIPQVSRLTVFGTLESWCSGTSTIMEEEFSPLRRAARWLGTRIK